MIFPFLSFLIFLPLVGTGFLTLIPFKKKYLLLSVAGFSGINFLLTLFLLYSFESDISGYQYIEYIPWIKRFGISYSLGVDGFALALVALSNFLIFLSCLSPKLLPQNYPRAFLICLLALSSGVVGVFCARDGFLFYLFWEVVLIPVYLMIGFWGGEKRYTATIKFFCYTMSGSVLMLGAFIYLSAQHAIQFGNPSYAFDDWLNLRLSTQEQWYLFTACFLAFAIKIPLFPFHTWLPAAYTQAPFSVTALMSGVLSKMGLYGFFRLVIPSFPEAVGQASPYLLGLALFSMLYAAIEALTQKDMKAVIAYASVSHLGLASFGLFALTQEGIQGSMVFMINHGIITGGLFLGLAVLQGRYQTTRIAHYGGMIRTIPKFSVIFIIMGFASIGIPGLSGFPGEFMILLGSYSANPLPTVIAVSTMILAAGYMLGMIQKVFLGPVKFNTANNDLKISEYFIFIPLLILILFFGVYPQILIGFLQSSVIEMAEFFSFKSASLFSFVSIGRELLV